MVPLVGILQLNSLPFPGTTLGVELFYMSCSVILRGDLLLNMGPTRLTSCNCIPPNLLTQVVTLMAMNKVR